MRTPKTTVIILLAAGMAFQAASGQEEMEMTLIVAEDFSGDSSTELNGTDADTFSSAILSKGGSATWGAAPEFKTDGSVNVTNCSAFLNLGSYIDDTKGTEAGYFELSATISETTGTWLSLGFSILNEPETTQVGGSTANFTSGVGAAPDFKGVFGIGTILYRAPNEFGRVTELDMFIGPQTVGSTDGPEVSGPRTVTVILDFRPEVYDGVSSFGTVTWRDSTLGDVNNLGTAYPLPDESFGSILLSAAEDSVGSYSELTLSQVLIETIPMRITPATSPATGFDLEWDSWAGKVYNLRSSTELIGPITEWPLVEGGENLAATPPSNLFNVPQDGPKRFYAVEAFNAPPLLEADFENDDGSFTTFTVEGSAWAWGAPDSDGIGGTVDAGNGGSARAWGVNLGSASVTDGDAGFYADPTDTALRSPVIDLTGVAAAELNFAEALDLPASDSAVVNLIDATTNSVIAQVHTSTDSDTSQAPWTAIGPIDLAAGLGQAIRIEWCLEGTGSTTDDYLGWYIDDVTVTETTP